MKDKDLQRIVKIKHDKGLGPIKIFRDLEGVVSLPTINRWIKSIKVIGDIDLKKSPGRPRKVRTKNAIKFIKNRLKSKKRLSSNKFAKELNISQRSVRRILHEDLGCSAYKIRKEPAIKDDQKDKRVKFANWILNNFTEDQTKKILFSDEKIFSLDGVYNIQNDRIWAVNRKEADKKGGIKRLNKFPTKVMVWLGVCVEGLTTLVILDKGTLNHEIYIKKVLPVAKRCGNKMLGDNWTFQQDGATSHTHHLSQQWCADNLPSFISKTYWPPNSPDLNPLDYSIWNELVQSMNWNNVKTKSGLINELKRAVKKIKKENVSNAVLQFTIRLHSILNSKGDYII